MTGASPCRSCCRRSQRFRHPASRASTNSIIPLLLVMLRTLTPIRSRLALKKLLVSSILAWIWSSELVDDSSPAAAMKNLLSISEMSERQSAGDARHRRVPTTILWASADPCLRACRSANWPSSSMISFGAAANCASSAMLQLRSLGPQEIQSSAGLSKPAGLAAA